MNIIHDEATHQFRFESNGKIAALLYRRDGDVITFVHAEVPASLQGTGIGSEIVRTGLAYAREQHLRVVPRCPFVAEYMQRHPEYQDLLAAR